MLAKKNITENRTEIVKRLLVNKNIPKNVTIKIMCFDSNLQETNDLPRLQELQKLRKLTSLIIIRFQAMG